MVVDQPEGLLKDHPNVTVMVDWTFKTSVLPSFLAEGGAGAESSPVSLWREVKESDEAARSCEEH